MIFIKDLTKITDIKYSVGYIHYMPFDSVNGLKKTQEELLEEGKLVELPSKLAEVEGKIQVMYYNPITNLCFWEYEDAPISEKTDIELLKIQVENSNQAITELSMIVGGMFNV